jgi:hypothetical protein
MRTLTDSAARVENATSAASAPAARAAATMSII